MKYKTHHSSDLLTAADKKKDPIPWAIFQVQNGKPSLLKKELMENNMKQGAGTGGGEMPNDYTHKDGI